MSEVMDISKDGKAAVAGIGGCAAAGAAIGSLVPGPGTVIGAGIGAIAGGIAVVAIACANKK